MRIVVAGIAGLGFALAAGSSHAAAVSLNFEGIYRTYPGTNNAQISNFYNGGTSSIGTSGTNYGAQFGDDALAVCLNTGGTVCSDASRGGVGDPNSAFTGLLFTDDAAFLNYTAGFTTGFSFNYVSPFDLPIAPVVTVYDGLNGTGNVLATLTLPTTPGGGCPAYSATFCPFVPSGLAFAGTAMSVSFTGTGGFVGFDDVTFGSVAPGAPSAVPIPAALPLFVSALGLGGLLGYRRKCKLATA